MLVKKLILLLPFSDLNEMQALHLHVCSHQLCRRLPRGCHRLLVDDQTGHRNALHKPSEILPWHDLIHDLQGSLVCEMPQHIAWAMQQACS